MLSLPQKLVSFAVPVRLARVLMPFRTPRAVSATLNVMSMYHDTLLAKVGQSDPKYKPVLPSAPHTRYTRAWCDKDARYKWFARALELIRFTELLLEMGLRRKVSQKTRWRGIVLLEVIKCVPNSRIKTILQPSL